MVSESIFSSKYVNHTASGYIRLSIRPWTMFAHLGVAHGPFIPFVN